MEDMPERIAIDFSYLETMDNRFSLKLKDHRCVYVREDIASQNVPEIKIMERGWAGHFIASDNCAFRRNTLVEYGDRRIVVSTVGNYDGRDNQIGINRTFETMAFEARFEAPYWEADVGREMSFKSPWSISELERDTDAKANDMHEAVVIEIKAMLAAPSAPEAK